MDEEFPDLYYCSKHALKVSSVNLLRTYLCNTVYYAVLWMMLKLFAGTNVMVCCGAFPCRKRNNDKKKKRKKSDIIFLVLDRYHFLGP